MRVNTSVLRRRRSGPNQSRSPTRQSGLVVTGPTAMDITAEFSTGWIPPWIPPEEYPGRIESLNELAVEKGRGGTEFDIATEVYVSLAETRDEAITSAEKTLNVLTEGFDHTATQEAISNAGLVGSADDITEKNREIC